MNEVSYDSGFYLQRGIKKMNEAVRRIPGLSTGEDEPDMVISKLSVLKEEIREDVKAGLQDIWKAAELDPGNFDTESFAKEGVSNLNDIELLDVLAAIEYDKSDYAFKTLSQILKNNQENIKAKELFDLVRNSYCWFCKKKGVPLKPDPAGSIKIPMHKEIGGESSPIKWEKLEISIPRCAGCLSVHSHDFRIGAGAGLIMGLLINAAAGLFAGDFSILYFMAVNLITTASGTLLHSIYKGNSRRGSYPVSRRDSFPPLIKRELEGWRTGENPPGITGSPISGGGGGGF